MNSTTKKRITNEDIHASLDFYGKDSDKFDSQSKTESETMKKDSQAKFYVEPQVTLQNEWNSLFGKESLLLRFQRSALGGQLGTSNFRSVCWRIFWECLSESPNKWKHDVVEKREWYSNIRKKYVINPHQDDQEEVDIEKHHPLSLAEDSIWNKYFQDNELRSLILQDLDRLYPEIDFFQQDNIKNYILNILFCYARENPQVSYKQGMHEIISPLVYVIYKNCVQIKESKEPLSDDVKMVLDFNYIEHDAYCLFYNIMESIQPWYVDLRVIKKQQNHAPHGSSNMFQKPDSKPVNAISNKLQRIQGSMLHKYDPELANHLKKIEVTPQVYGIRWVRLLFGREFPMNRLLILWDAIFAGGMALELVEYIYIAMLMHLRNVLIQSDLSHCLSYLMKFPQNTDPRTILHHALELKKSKNKSLPSQRMNQHKPHHRTGANKHQPPPNQHRPHTPSQRNITGDVPKTKPSIHPVKYRLGETEEQRYAQALAGNHYVSYSKGPTKSNKVVSRSNFYVEDSIDGKDKNLVHGTGEVVKTEFSKEKTVFDKPGMTANFRERMGSGAQLISRLPNTLKDAMTSPRQEQNNSYFDAIVEDHARLQLQVSELKSDLDSAHEMSLYCSQKMDSYLTLMQERFFQAENFNDELTILGLAGLKQVREILKGQDMDDVDFSDIDRHVGFARGKLERTGDILKLKENESDTPIPIMADFDHYNKSNEGGICESSVSQSANENDIINHKGSLVENDVKKTDSVLCDDVNNTTEQLYAKDTLADNNQFNSPDTRDEDQLATNTTNTLGVDFFADNALDTRGKGLFATNVPDTHVVDLFASNTPDTRGENLFATNATNTHGVDLFAPVIRDDDLFASNTPDTHDKDLFTTNASGTRGESNQFAANASCEPGKSMKTEISESDQTASSFLTSKLSFSNENDTVSHQLAIKPKEGDRTQPQTSTEWSDPLSDFQT